MGNGFTCEDCGIAHSHEKGLDHSLSGAFSKATVVLSLDLDYNSDCHCGWHEFNSKIKEGELSVNKEIAAFVDYRCESLLIPESVEQDLYEDLEA